tara:strand:- start:396 stop:533 length:138 start_codon:yes stop_codon:yes gene_type:complete
MFDGYYNMSMLVISNDGDVTGYDRETSELSNAILNIKQDITSIEI